MAIIGGLFAALGRFAGKVVTMLLAWASVLLFGRVPQRKQSLLAFITLGSIAWVGTLVGVLIPDVGAFWIGIAAAAESTYDVAGAPRSACGGSGASIASSRQ